MQHVRQVRICYIGGGSRGWAWALMADLSNEKGLAGEVVLYDIDADAAEKNMVIGNNIIRNYPDCSPWKYTCAGTLKEALTGADIVIISILPGSFDEMEFDVELPKEYGVYQSVGDTVGLGGVVRAIRAVPMFREIALGIKEFAPDAFVINYTNPMSICLYTLYKVMPEIKAIGCCHEVFGSQKLLAAALKHYTGIEAGLHDINIEVCGINHFTWITKAYYKDIDVMPYYDRLANEFHQTGFSEYGEDNWENSSFYSKNMIKFDLYKRFGVMAAAGDRHLAEFCPSAWYLKNLDRVAEYKFGLTSVMWRKLDLEKRKLRSQRLCSGEETFWIGSSGEVGVQIIKALAGGDTLKTNVNYINIGQMPQLPIGTMVETNALFSTLGAEPMTVSAKLPDGVMALVERAVKVQTLITDSLLEGKPEYAYQAFLLDASNILDLKASATLMRKMVEGSKKYIPKDYYAHLDAFLSRV